MVYSASLSHIEHDVVSWLENNNHLRLKDFFLADLSWADTDQQRTKAFVDFFTTRMGTKVFDLVPQTIRDYVLQRRLNDQG